MESKLRMFFTKQSASVITLTGVFFLMSAVGAESASQQTGKRRHGPPPEAYTACEGKSEGDEAQFTSPRGDTVTGTCEERDGRLLLRPDRSKMRQGGRHHSPPPEAFSACDGKSVGDQAQFVSPRGDTVTGTCEQQDDRLVLRPDRGGRRPGGRAPGDSDD